MKSSTPEITPNNLEQNIQKLREEFNKKNFINDTHPKTSHEYKRALANKKINRANKALSANKFKWSNINKLNDKEMLEFSRKHPGYLYYKEIMENMKYKQYSNPIRRRAFTGKDYLSKKMKIDYINNTGGFRKVVINNYNHGNRHINNLFMNRNEKFPNISKTNYFNGQNKQKWKTNYIKNFNYNFNYNNYNYSHNYNYNINNININIKDKKNPYSLSWVNKFLNQNDYKLEIKEKPKAKPKLSNINNAKKKVNKEKINILVKEIKEKKEDNVVNIDKENNNKEEDKEEELDEEQQMQFYKNQKNFFKARKDIQEEPEDLEEDKDEDNKNKNIINDNINNNDNIDNKNGINNKEINDNDNNNDNNN